MAQRRIGRAAVNVIDAEHVGQEKTVEPAALQRARQPGPVIEGGIAGRTVARMRPQPRRLCRPPTPSPRCEVSSTVSR